MTASVTSNPSYTKPSISFNTIPYTHNTNYPNRDTNTYIPFSSNMHNPTNYPTINYQIPSNLTTTTEVNTNFKLNSSNNIDSKANNK